MTDWHAYRSCPVCRVQTGKPCKSLSGKVVNGQTDGCETELAEPHKSGPLRSGHHNGWCKISWCVACAVQQEARRLAARADA